MFTGKFKIFKDEQSFEFMQGESLTALISRNQVPDAPGVYMFIVKGVVTYIGKAGTLKNDGTFKGQKLRRRIGNKQNGQSRESFFKSELKKGIGAIKIYWHQTCQIDVKTGNICDDGDIPAKVEAELLSEYYKSHKRLPVHNRQF